MPFRAVADCSVARPILNPERVSARLRHAPNHHDAVDPGLEDEYSIVTEGEIGFRSGDREAVLGAGGYITKPRGEMHAMWNAGSVPARMIEIISPAGFEHFFRELADLVAAGPPDPSDIAAIAQRYGLQFGEPDWLPGIVDRYKLTPLS